MIKVLGIPFHFGQKNREVAYAPQALREKGFVEDLKCLDDVISLSDICFDDLKNDVQKVSRACQLINQRVFKEMSSDAFLINVGGDHGISLGTISAILERDPETIVIWVDAHGDINTPESSKTKNFHGMPLSYLLGLNKNDENFAWLKTFLRPEKLIYFGVRDLDPFEFDLIEKLGIQFFSSEQMNKIGSERLLKHALKIADPNGECNIHLSFDLDVFDRNDFKSTGIALPGGPHISEVLNLVSFLERSKKLLSMDLVEYHPGVNEENDNFNSYKLIWELISQVLKKS